MTMYCSREHSIVDADREPSQISRSMVYFLPTFQLPFYAYSCSVNVASDTCCYDVPSLDRWTMAVDPQMIPGALCDDVVDDASSLIY